MFQFPTALLTCLFFLVLCAIIDLAINSFLYVVARFELFGGFVVFGTWFTWVFSGGLWCLSFYWALRVQHMIWRSRLPPHLHN